MTFRGAAGEVVRGFVRPSGLLTLVAVLLISGVGMLVGAVLAEGLALGAPAMLVVALVTSAGLIGRFALAARDGDLEAGFVSGRFDGRALGAFVLRYLVLTILWAVPALVAGAWVLTRLGAALVTRDVEALVAAGPAGLLGVVLLVVGLLAPTLSLVIATYTDSVAEVLSLGPWRWLLGERRSDLVPFYASLLGGCLLFAAMTAAIVAVAAALSVAVSPPLAALLVGFGWVAPAAAAPILLGRLCGAFVAADGGLRDPGEGLRRRALVSADLPPAAVAALAGLTPPPGATALGPRGDRRPTAAPSPSEAQRRMRTKAEIDLAGAIADGEGYLLAHPGNPGIATELAELYRRAGRQKEARRAAALAIERALGGGMNAFAVEVLARFAEERAELDLTSPLLQQLGWSLLQRRELDQAAWCFETADARGTDAKAEKGLVAVADATAAAGDVAGALTRYAAFLRQHPASVLAGQVRSAVARLERGRGHAAPRETA